MTHWIVATINGDMTEDWSVFETYRDALKAYDAEIAAGAYSTTICAVVMSTDYDIHPMFADDEVCVECGTYQGRRGDWADTDVCLDCSEVTA